MSDRSAVRAKKRREFFRRVEVGGFVEVAGDGGSVFALEMNVFDFGKAQLRNKRVIGLGQAREIAAVLKEDFVGTIGACRFARRSRRLCRGNKYARDAAADGASDVSPGCGDAAKILRAIIFRNEIDGVAIGGKARAAHTAVESERQNFCFAAGGRSDGEMVRGVVNGFGVDLADEGDPFPVGRPGGRAVRAGIRGDLRQVRALVGVFGVNDPDVGVEVAVGIGRGAVAGEGQRFAVGRPGGFAVVEIAGSDLR